MPNSIIVKNTIENFNKSITVSGDKSLSIRWVLFSSIAKGKSKAYNLLLSEDVLAAINAVKKLGAKVKLDNNCCSIIGTGLNGYKYKKNITINSENSGTLGRLIMGLLIDTPYKIKIFGDKSLSKRDFYRIAEPLRKFGADIKLTNKGLPLTIHGIENPKPIKYLENKGSAQCKSSVILAGLKTTGKTFIKAKKSRNHTELLCEYLNLPIKVKRKKFDLIEVEKIKKIKPLNYNIPSDISSAAFFIVLTALSNNSKLLIRNVNINPSRIGIVTILKKMGVNIKFKNKKKYKGELIADISISSTKKIKAINCPPKLNSGAIDEFLTIFLVAAKASGVSYFRDIGELNQKESPRLKWGAKILNKMGIETITTKDSIKIFGNPNLSINKKIVIKDYLKDHRVFMTSVIAASVFGGTWNIHDKDSIKTSFPKFIKIIENLKKTMIKRKNIIKIAIDSPAAAGAGTLAKAISKHYNLFYLDTGKIYRMIAYLKIKFPKKFNQKFIKSKIKTLKVKDLANKALLSDEVGTEASVISKVKSTRKLVHSFQLNFAYNPPKNYKGSCLDGRDITYNIVPDADFKFFITANVKTRALRRYKELKSLKKEISFKEVLKSIQKRDKSDYNRKISPLKKTKDSVLLNTSKLTKRACFLKIKKIIDRKINT